MSPLLYPLRYGPADNKGLIGLLKRPRQFCVILALQSTQIRTSLPFLLSQSRVRNSAELNAIKFIQHASETKCPECLTVIQYLEREFQNDKELWKNRY